jgi:3-oxoacyl-(acyl-carrier-protein) synthase
MQNSSSHNARPGGERVYVTGLGLACALGFGAQALAKALWEETDRREDQGVVPASAARVPEFDMADYVETVRTYLDPHSRFALAAASLALASYGPDGNVADQARSGLSLGTVFGNAASSEVFQRGMREKGVRLASPVLFPHCYANTSNSLVCIEFGLRGYNQNFCGDPLCGAKALQAGNLAVRAGLADLMLAGGVEAFSKLLLDALSAEDAAPDALPPGEGACFLVLESERSVAQRRSTPICELASVTSCGTGVVGPLVRQEDEEHIAGAISSAIGRALKDAGLWEGSLGAIFLAGTRASADDPVSRAGDIALSGFSQLPAFVPPREVGNTYAAAFALQCTAAALVTGESALPAPPKLEGVKGGVELWVEQVPSGLLGEAVLVLDWSHRHVVAAVLKCL